MTHRLEGASELPAGRRFYPGVEILRGFAAMMVLVYHVIAHGQWTTFPQEGPLLLFRLGWLGVDLFLVISGFVIALAVINGISKAGSPGAFRRDFAERRWRRIAPLYFLTLLAFLFMVQPGLLLQGWQVMAWHVGTHALFLHNLTVDTHGSINGPNWSVALEMQFYLLMLVFGPWLVRQRPWLSALLLIGVALAWRAGTFLVLGGADAAAHKMHIFTTQLPGSLDEFAVGIFLAMLVTAKPRFAAAVAPGWARFAGWLGVAGFLTFAAMWVFWPRGDYWPRWEMVVGWRTLLAVALGAIIVAAMALPLTLVRLTRPLRYLGEISYGIYLWHLPVLLTLLAAGMSGGLPLLLTTLAGTLLLAAFSWHFVERPYLQRRKPAPAPDGLQPTAPDEGTRLPRGIGW
ncbi:acyltransferase family protein [Arenimonas sp.]|uniref:acyltransferase family protein n=1 Tax=Arenimonas sp. TaxID=1872635 RepID=UPI0035B24EB6